MRERGDLTCFHEPFLGDYYLNRKVASMTHLQVDSDAPRTYAEARAAILDAAEVKPVFFKDMSYYVVPHLFEDLEFVERLTHIFLIRDPRRSLASYQKLDPTFTTVEGGLLAQLEHVSWLEEQTGETPVVVEAEVIQRDPIGTMSAIWKQIGLEDRPDALSWTDATVPSDWQHVVGWHGAAAQSTGIRTDADSPPAIEVFKSAAAKAPRLHDILNAHWPAYLALRDRARQQAADRYNDRNCVGTD